LAGAAERRPDRCCIRARVRLGRVARGGKLALTSRVAFGPHLALAFWLVWLFGPVVIV
jgi:prepilin signal peptidase PulO-like enzyme (type II secretory pathway)